MKSLNYIRIIFACMVMCPGCLYVKSQEIRISGGAHLVMTGNVKIVLQDASANNYGTLTTINRNVIFTGQSNINEMKNGSIDFNADNILVKRPYEQVNISLGREIAFNKLSSVQPVGQVFPNPTTERFTLTIPSDKEMERTITMHDESGRVLERRQVNCRAGLNTIQWNISKYAAGNYFLSFDDAARTYLKIVKQ